MKISIPRNEIIMLIRNPPLTGSRQGKSEIRNWISAFYGLVAFLIVSQICLIDSLCSLQAVYAADPPAGEAGENTEPKPAGTEETKKVVEIELTGLKRHSPEEIKAQLQTKEKELFSVKLLESDIQRLFDTGWFKHIDWKRTELAEGIKITITFTENEIIEDVVFVGFKAINPNTFKDELKSKKGGYLSQYQINFDQSLIREKYMKDGYYFVEVNATKTDGLRGVLISYSVREGPRVIVKDIKIVGNNSFQPYCKLLLFWQHPLMDLMNTQPSHWYGSNVYNESELSNDLVRIESFYHSEGWLDAKVFVEDIIFSETKSDVSIIIRVEEGSRYQIRDLKLVGNTVISSDEILRQLKVKAGMPYQTATLNKAEQSIRRIYGKLGHIDVNIEPRTYSPQEGIIDVYFHIKEGMKQYAEKINISGNIKTRDKVIRRELVLQPGDLLDYENIEKSRQNIASTMYFSSIKYNLDDTDYPDKKNLNFQVEETMTANLQLGGGYSSTNKWGGALSLVQRNFDFRRLPNSFADFFSGNSFAGGGQQLAFTWQPGELTSRFSINFTEPYLWDKPLELGLDYSIWQREWLDYNEWRKTQRIFLGHRFSNGLEMGVGPTFQRIEISHVEETAPDVIKDLRGLNDINALGTSLSLDRRDNRLFPTLGYRSRIDFTYNGGFMGGDFDFAKTFYKVETFNPLPVEIGDRAPVLNLIARFGRVQELGNTGTIPFFERFYAGGTDTVRGFNYRTISPKEDGIAVGGNFLALFNLEVTYPLYSEEIAERPFDIARMVLFFDAGNVADHMNELDWDTFRTSVGFGFRFYIGTNPLTLNFGYPLRKEPGDERETIQFDIGLMY